METENSARVFPDSQCYHVRATDRLPSDTSKLLQPWGWTAKLGLRLLHWMRSIPHIRRDGRVVEGARLESVFRGNSNVGSNPTLSATRSASQRALSSPRGCSGTWKRSVAPLGTRAGRILIITGPYGGNRSRPASSSRQPPDHRYAHRKIHRIIIHITKKFYAPSCIAIDISVSADSHHGG